MSRRGGVGAGARHGQRGARGAGCGTGHTTWRHRRTIAGSGVGARHAVLAWVVRKIARHTVVYIPRGGTGNCRQIATGEVGNDHSHTSRQAPPEQRAKVATRWVGELWLERVDGVVCPQLCLVAGRVAVEAALIITQPQR